MSTSHLVLDATFVARRENIGQAYCSKSDELVQIAHSLIDELGRSNLNTFEYWGVQLPSLALLLEALLCHTHICGGDVGTKYMAASIVACSVAADGDLIDQLRTLAITFLTHFLFPFKSGQLRTGQTDLTPSDTPTPTEHDFTRSQHHRDEDLRAALLRRDGYRCIVSGWVDERHPNIGQLPGITECPLEVAYILDKSIVCCDLGNKKAWDSLALESTACTVDILRRYANIPDDLTNRLLDKIDDPCNGLMLQDSIHKGFRRYDWCFQLTDVPDEYKINMYNKRSAVRALIKAEAKEEMKIRFVDHSTEIAVPVKGKGKKRIADAMGVALPDPLFIKIHAAVAGVLNMSGAGRFFNELLKKFDDDDSEPEVPSWKTWEEFDKIIRSRAENQA